MGKWLVNKTQLLWQAKRHPFTHSTVANTLFCLRKFCSQIACFFCPHHSIFIRIYPQSTPITELLQSTTVLGSCKHMLFVYTCLRQTNLFFKNVWYGSPTTANMYNQKVENQSCHGTHHLFLLSLARVMQGRQSFCFGTQKSIKKEK